MKKIIFLLLISVASYGQAVFDEGIQLSGNGPTISTSKILSQDSNGYVNYINAITLPVSTPTQTILATKLTKVSTVTGNAQAYVKNAAGAQVMYDIAAPSFEFIYGAAAYGGVFDAYPFDRTALSGLVGSVPSSKAVKDYAADDLKVIHTTGNETKTDILTLSNILNFPTTIANTSNGGFITKNGSPFIHNFYAGTNPASGLAGQNISVGLNSGNFNSNNFAYASTYLGEEAGKSNTDGYSNVWIGHYVGQNNTVGFGNASVGTNTMTANISGSQNASLGWHSLLHHTSGDGNTAVGADALLENITGQRNTSIGKGSGGLNLGSDNTFLGYNAGNAETGSNKLYISNAFNTLIQGDFNTGNLTLNAETEIRPSVNSWVQFKTGGGSVSVIKFSDNTGGFQNAYIDAYDYTLRTGTSDRFYISNSGVVKIPNLSGTGARTVVADANGNLSATDIAPTSGTYTPTRTPIVNCSSINGIIIYTKIGNIVSGTLRFSLTETTANTQTRFSVTLPINRTLTTGSNAIGAGVIQNSFNQNVFAQFEATNNSMSITYDTLSGTGIRGGVVSFQYSVLE